MAFEGHLYLEQYAPKVQNETHKIPTSSGVIDAEWICEKRETGI